MHFLRYALKSVPRPNTSNTYIHTTHAAVASYFATIVTIKCRQYKYMQLF